MTETGSTGRRSRAVLFGNNRQEERRLERSIATVRTLLTDDLRVLGEADVRTLPEKSPTGVRDEAQAAATGTGLLVVYLCGRLFHGPDGVPVLATAGAWDADVLPGVRLDTLLEATGSAEQRLIIVDGVTIKPSGGRTQKWLDSLTDNVDSTCLLIAETDARNVPAPLAPLPFTGALGEALHKYPQKQGQQLIPLTVGNIPDLVPTDHTGRSFHLYRFVGRDIADRKLAEVSPANHPTRTFLGGLPAWSRKRWLPATIVVVAAAVVAGSIVFPWGDGDQATACGPPQELRVLASPESRPAVQATAADFAGAYRDSNGCRLAHATVYQAGTEAVLRGFAQADRWAHPVGGTRTVPLCAGVDTTNPEAASDPGVTVGPRPDVWFPDSSVDVTRARCVAAGSAAVIGDPASVAWSPLVVGVPPGLPPPPADWKGLAAYLTEHHPLRPNPTTSTAGLLHTIALYDPIRSDPGAIQNLEHGLTPRNGEAAISDSVDLLCDPKRPPDSAVLVSEVTLASYNVGGSACPDRATRPLDVVYPAPTVALDHPVVAVTWRGEPNNQARAQAVRAFREWLLSDAGQARLSASGLHPVRNVPPAKDSPLAKPNSHVPGNPPAWDNRTPTNVDETISLYGKAHTAGRVVFLVDVSWSMSNNGNMALAKTIVNTALGVMGPQDQVGLTTVPKTTGASDELNELVPPYVENTREKVTAALGGVVPVRNGAALFDAVNLQLGQMRKNPGPLKQTLVVITDGEDKDDSGVNPLSKQSIDTLLGTYGGQLTVEVVALPPTSCSAGLDRLAAGLNGRCASNVDNRTGSSLVAGVWGG